MVNPELDQVYKPKEAEVIDYAPLPNGDYIVKITNIEDWKQTIKTVQVIQRNANGYPMQDEKGKNITDTVKDCKIYNAKVTFEITSNLPAGTNGRKVFYNITTHPNMPWVIPAFLYGCGMTAIPASQIQKDCLGKTLIITTALKEYTKDITDQDTGIVKQEKRSAPEVKKLQPIIGKETVTKNEFEAVE